MIIGISGKKGSGKDTVATFIKEFLPQYENKSFAGKLKEMIAILLNVSTEQLEDRGYKESNLGWLNSSPRELMQKLGTEWGRSIDEDIWVKALLADYDINENWIITDVRFPNEADAINKAGGVVIRVYRGDSSDTHPSETSLDNYPDFVYKIVNTGSLKDLRNQVEFIIEEIL
jgi:hypothetical protein